MRTYEDLTAEYARAHACMTDNLGTNFNFPRDSPATWLNQETLARWLYNASNEFYVQFKHSAERFFGTSKAFNAETLVRVAELESLIHQTRERFVKGWGVISLPALLEGASA